MRKTILLLMLLAAANAQATIGPPIQLRVLGEIPDFTAGLPRTVTLELTTSEAVLLEMPQFAGRGWTIHSTTMPASKAMTAGERSEIEVVLSGNDPDELVEFGLFAGAEYFQTSLDFSADAAARSRGEALPARAEIGGMEILSTPPADADAPGAGKAARNIRVWGRVWTTRPDGVNIGMPECRIDIWEDDVEPNPDDFITTGYTNDGGTFDITFWWDAVSEAEPDLYFTFWLESGNVRVQDGNGNAYGYNTASGTTWNYTGTDLAMGTWFPAGGQEATGFLYAHVHRGSEILWLDGGASEVWDTPKVNVQWFASSTNGPDYNSNLIRMPNARVWGEGVIHHEFGHHWHNSFGTMQSFNYCNSICDGSGCGHCLWCNEDQGSALNEGFADFVGELLTGAVAAVYGPAPYAGAGSELYNFETTNPSSSQCPGGHVASPTINEGYFAALLRDIADTQNDNDPNVGSGVDQLSLSWEEILKTFDLDVPTNAMDFLAKFNARYNGFQSALAQTALNNGFNVSASMANIVPYAPSGWAYALVPRSTNNASGGSVAVSPTLNGNSNSTYLNAAFRNSGGFPSINGINNFVQVDGVGQLNLTAGAIWNGSWVYGINFGPVTVRGGRHTQTLIVDATNTESEFDELDNDYGRQWIWSPFTLATGVIARAAPPIKNAGWSSIPSGSPTIYENSDGFRLSSSGSAVQAVAMRGLGASDDYDLFAHDPSTGSQNGFGAFLETSAYISGYTEFILLNYRVASTGNRDFGVVNYNGGSGQFHIERSNDLSTTVVTAVGQSKVHAILQNQMVQVGEVYTPVGGTGPTYLQVDVAPAGSPVSVAWYDAATGIEGRALASATVKTDATGRARIFMDTVENTRSPFVIFRDAVDGFAPVTVTIKADAAPAELATAMAPGSVGVVVPRDNTWPGIAIGDPIPAPAILVGDQARTNIYVQLANTGPRASAQYAVGWMIDGNVVANFDFGTAPANSGLIGNVAGAFFLSGGRHTVGEFVDSFDNNVELDETNNRWAAQWVWEPATLGIGNSLVRSAPPAPTGGWSDIPSGVQAHPNFDGVRTPVFLSGNGQFAAAAILPFAGSDHDLHLFEPSTGPDHGFRFASVASSWGAGASDYALANLALTGPRAFDLGVQQSSGTGSYRVHVVQSTDIGSAPVAQHVATLNAAQILHLYQVELPAEEIELRLENRSGNVNWGFTVHSPQQAWDNKASANGWVHDLVGAGGDENFLFDAPVAGRYAIAVWKSGSADEGLSGEYALTVFPTLLTDTPSAELPRVSAIASVQPNPFNPRTTIAFDLAREGVVAVELFDLAGHRVRSLMQGVREPGRHTATWDGLDDAGRQVASGVYFVRLIAGDQRDQRKVLLLK